MQEFQSVLTQFIIISTRSIRSFDNLFFKFNVSLPLDTGELLQKTVDVSSDNTTNTTSDDTTNVPFSEEAPRYLRGAKR